MSADADEADAVTVEFEVRTDADGFSFVVPAEGFDDTPYWLIDEVEATYLYRDLPKPKPGEVGGPYTIDYDPEEEIIVSDPEAADDE